MLRSPVPLARLLLLASALSIPGLARSDEPGAAAGAAAQAHGQANASGPAAPRKEAEGAAPGQEPSAAAAPSLSPRLTPAPAAPPSAPSPGAEQKEKSAAGAAAPAGPVLTVAEISDDAVRLAGPNVGLAPKQVGRVIARDGATVGRIVIVRVLENGAEGVVVSGRENVAWGARVRFEAPARR
jgi:hypothetical protein